MRLLVASFFDSGTPFACVEDSAYHGDVGRFVNIPCVTNNDRQLGASYSEGKLYFKSSMYKPKAFAQMVRVLVLQNQLRQDYPIGLVDKLLLDGGGREKRQPVADALTLYGTYRNEEGLWVFGFVGWAADRIDGLIRLDEAENALRKAGYYLEYSLFGDRAHMPVKSRARKLGLSVADEGQRLAAIIRPHVRAKQTRCEFNLPQWHQPRR